MGIYSLGLGHVMTNLTGKDILTIVAILGGIYILCVGMKTPPGGSGKSGGNSSSGSSTNNNNSNNSGSN